MAKVAPRSHAMPFATRGGAAAPTHPTEAKAKGRLAVQDENQGPEPARLCARHVMREEVRWM